MRQVRNTQTSTTQTHTHTVQDALGPGRGEDGVDQRILSVPRLQQEDVAWGHDMKARRSAGGSAQVKG